MSVWMKNLQSSLENKEVIILHGNVRDKYIDKSRNLVYDNLTDLIKSIGKSANIPFSNTIFYDPVGQERKVETQVKSENNAEDSLKISGRKPSDELSGTGAREREKTQKAPPSRILAKWSKDLAGTSDNTLATIFYLDKVVGYKTSYTPDERELILRMEKIIENITPNNRLIMVALQDTMIPIELYTNSPKTHIIPIPRPDKDDREEYILHRLGEEYELHELVADLTDGLFLKDLDNIIKDIRKNPGMSEREIRKVINKYRIGEQEDYWGALDIKKLHNAHTWFSKDQGVKGQPMAIDWVIATLCLARAGLSGVASGTISKPKGVLFFSGPTGVGKTLVAKKLALFLFSSEDAFIRFDMSEFKEEHTVSKLIGSPPGYVGYEKGGMLTNAVREKPFSVILFDEVEKAHFKIMDIFLQILDEGRLTDSRGQTVFFTETIIIFTSNIGTRTTDSRGNPIPEKIQLDQILKNDRINESTRKELIFQHFVRAVEHFFMFEISRPELLNRIGNNIVPFGYIDSNDVQKQIIVSHFERIKDEIEEKYKPMGLKLSFEQSAIDYVIDKYGDMISKFGGRGITNAIKTEVMMPLAASLLNAEYFKKSNIILRIVGKKGRIRIIS